MGAGRSAASERRCQPPILWLTVGWKPKLIFLPCSVSAGSCPTAGSSLSPRCSGRYISKISQLVVGLKYTDLTYYNKGDQLCVLVVEDINSSIDGVLLPVLSAEQDSRDHVARRWRGPRRKTSSIS